MATYRIMSNNQWYCDRQTDAWKALGIDSTGAVREEGFARFYRETQPDLIGLQEVSPTMAESLMTILTADGGRYALLWGHDTPVIYRSDRFELVDSDFRLYPDDVPGWDGCFNNSQTKSWCIAVLRAKETGKRLIFASTHLWWKSSNPALSWYQTGSDEARAYQLGMLMDRVAQFQAQYNAPAIIVGDLNAKYASPAVQAALSRGYRHAHDIAVEFANEEDGMHECGPDGYEPYTPATFAESIDHILIKDAPEGFVRRFDRAMPDYYLTLSDHAPTWIDVQY